MIVVNKALDQFLSMKIFIYLFLDYFVHNEQVRWTRAEFVQDVFVVGLVDFLSGELDVFDIPCGWYLSGS